MPRGRSLCVSLVPETKSWNRRVETNSEVYKLKMSGSKFLPPWTHSQHSDSTSPPSQNKKNNFFNCSAPASFALRKACCTSPRPNLCAKGVNSSRPWGITKMQIQSENCVYLTLQLKTLQRETANCTIKNGRINHQSCCRISSLLGGYRATLSCHESTFISCRIYSLLHIS